MADLLFGRLEARSLSFTCFRKPYLPRRVISKLLDRNGNVSTPGALYLYNSMISGSVSAHCTSSASGSAAGDFGVVSTTEHSDGSFTFRFGDASEIERNVKVEDSQDSLGAAEEDGTITNEDFMKVEIDDCHLVEVTDADHSLKIHQEELIHTMQVNVDSHHNIENKSDTADFVNERLVHKNDAIALGSHTDVVVKANTEPNEDFILLNKNHILTPVALSKHSDATEGENKEAFEANGGSSRKGHVISTTASKLDLVIEGMASDILEVTEKDREDDIDSQARLISEPGFKIEGHNSYLSEAINKNTEEINKNTEEINKNTEAINENTEAINENTEVINENTEVINENTEAINENTEVINDTLDEILEKCKENEEADKRHLIEEIPKSISLDEEADKRHLIEEIPKSISLEGVLVLNDETSPVMVTISSNTGKTGNMDKTDTFEMANDYVSSSACEDVDGDVESNKIVEVSAAIATKLEMNEITPKRDEISLRAFILSSGVALLPSPSKALTGGEDSFFIAQNWLGVADGVGQWPIEGISGGLYAKELLNNCQKIVSDGTSNPVKDPVELLNRSAAETQSPGSSNVIVAYFDDQTLHVANIGDTGFMIVRTGIVVKRSSPMMHEFNFPLRLHSGDKPSELVEVYSIDLDEGDMIVIATDGLFDNLYDEEIALIVSESQHGGLKPQEIAELIASRAQEVGSSSSSRSPFADAAHATGYVGYSGGKLDNVTVIVSLVQKKS